MCELFGVSSQNKVKVNGYLETFFSHSEQHRNGWGIAVFYDNLPSVEKEPVQASKSAYLNQRLKHSIEVYGMIGHIRFATRGCDEYDNTHPFVMRDNFGRVWTFAHNGTIFNYPVLDKYFNRQAGSTDSERILCYIIDLIDRKQRELNRPLDEKERFALLDGIVCQMSEGNKLNFLLYDGEFLYAHSNYANSLYCLQRDNTVFFSTVPLDEEDWRLVKFTALLSYRNGGLVNVGSTHGKVYVDNENDSKLIFIDYSSL